MGPVTLGKAEGCYEEPSPGVNKDGGTFNPLSPSPPPIKAEPKEEKPERGFQICYLKWEDN